MTTTINRTATHRIGVAGAILLISASAALGAYYGFTVGSHTHFAIGLVFAGAALGGELLKPYAVALAFQSIRSNAFMQAAACTALSLVCIVYSFAAELSLAAGSRGDLASERRMSADGINAARNRRTRAESELQALPPARSAAEIDPMITKLKTTRGANGCGADVKGSAAREACSKIPALQSESARWQHRAEIEKRITSADDDLASAPSAVSEADPLASAIASYARALGYNWQPDTVAPWLALIPVLFLEIGSALSLTVLRTPTGHPRPDTTGGLMAPRPNVSVTAAIASPALPTPPPIEKAAHGLAAALHCDGGEPDAKLSARVTELLHKRGGRIVTGQRSLGRVLGISKSRVNEILHEMATAGRIALETSRTGTAIALA
jgi:hypothetical protein